MEEAEGAAVVGIRTSLTPIIVDRYLSPHGSCAVATHDWQARWDAFILVLAFLRANMCL